MPVPRLPSAIVPVAPGCLSASVELKVAHLHPLLGECVVIGVDRAEFLLLPVCRATFAWALCSCSLGVDRSKAAEVRVGSRPLAFKANLRPAPTARPRTARRGAATGADAGAVVSVPVVLVA